MSKVLFVNGNLHGHINPTLPVVKKLVHRGEEVYYFSTKEFQSRLDAAGAVFMDYGKEFDQFVQSFRPHGNHPFYTLMEYMLALDSAVIRIVLTKTAGIHFDYLIHDVMFGGGSVLSKKLNLPAFSTCSSFVMEKPPIPQRMLESGFHPQLDYLCGALETAAKEWGMDQLSITDIFFKRAAKNLVFTSRLFQPQGEGYDDTFCFAGPSIADRNEVLDFPMDSSDEKKTIYISMGTVLNNCVEFYNLCIEAFADSQYQVLLSVGSKVDISSLQQIPDNFVVRNYMPQLEVLKHTQVMISHGGLNSVSEALYYQVPVIAVPLANDQPAVAKRLVEFGAGLELKMEEITPALLKSTVHTILSQPSFREQANVIAASFVQAGGHKEAVNFIMQAT